MQKIHIVLLGCLISFNVWSQIPDVIKQNRANNRAGINNGHLYGKVVDSKTNKGIEVASIQLISTKFDTATKTKVDTIVAGMLTESNGDFSLENLPILGKFKIVITAIGYKSYEAPFSFNIKNSGNMLDNMDKDLGNIKLIFEPKELGDVTVTASKPLFQMGVDRKIFNVDKNLISAGQTATEIMKSIPSINVDIDGNITLRGAAPQLFVDGRPTSLSIDQIPADAIESVELITNPSAKYDASGGKAGILNIILKKNKKAGYNGNVRLGIDSRAFPSGGGDINVKQGKWNIFANMMYRGRKSIGEGSAFRENIIGMPKTDVRQNSDATAKGYLGFGRFGVDYLPTNRATFTLSQQIMQGKMSNNETLDLVFDSLYSTPIQETGYRKTLADLNFKNYNTALAFKQLFPQAGQELTADITYQFRSLENHADYTSQYFFSNKNPKSNATNQLLLTNSTANRLIIQTDYAYPLNEYSKVEMGVRASIRESKSENKNYINNILINVISSNYTYKEHVYAGYINYANKLKILNYQIGLRVESSLYRGFLADSGTNFGSTYPISLFPSISVTKSINNKQDIQLNYSRRIDRPNFFQLLPYIDYSDSLNLSRGNPDLKPEFIHAVELSYSNSFNKKHMAVTSLFYKYSDQIITRNQVKEISPINGKEVIINTYINVNSSQTYGLELTSRHSIAAWWDVMPNVNIYNSSINNNNANTQRWSWFGKLNTTFRIPDNWSLQIAGDYQSKTVIPQGNNGGENGGRGGGPFSTLSTTTAQGYINPNYGIDIAIKKEFLANKAASITLSMSDVLKTRKYDVFAQSDFFMQTSWRRRDWQLIQLNFNYRFGKINTSLFKRKNNKVNEGQDGSIGM